jgi:hypothetical protein
MGLTVMSNGRYERLEKDTHELSRTNAAINLILHLPERYGTSLLRLMRESKAQLPGFVCPVGIGIQEGRLFC